MKNIIISKQNIFQLILRNKSQVSERNSRVYPSEGTVSNGILTVFCESKNQIKWFWSYETNNLFYRWNWLLVIKQIRHLFCRGENKESK